jgi:hypothetical protein
VQPARPVARGCQIPRSRHGTALIWWFGLRPALPEAMALGLGIALWLVAVAVPGLLGNGWYWRKIRPRRCRRSRTRPIWPSPCRLQAQVSTAQQDCCHAGAGPACGSAAGAGLALLPAENPAPLPNVEPAAITRSAATAPPALPPLAPWQARSRQLLPRCRPTRSRPPEPARPPQQPRRGASAPAKRRPKPLPWCQTSAARAEPSEKPPATPADKPAAKPAAEPKEQPVKAASKKRRKPARIWLQASSI